MSAELINKKQTFTSFMEQLSTTNYTLDGFVDFDKVINNVDAISIKLNQLNYLIGKENLENAIEVLYKENKQCFSVLNILIAVRKSNTKFIFDNGTCLSIDSCFLNAAEIIKYINMTGLADIFRNKNISNLVDYVFGIEVGLDSNARKNRTGKNMEEHISYLLSTNNIDFSTEVNSTFFPTLNNLGTDIKKFDFVIKTPQKTYLIEVNYYNTGGSKLNEVARAYSDIAPKINQHKNFEFVWITDGQGWKKAKNKLEEAFSNIPHVYNLKSIYDFIALVNKESSS
ncbi:MAG: type II restriction endonuclease [Mariprofundales bacterium]